MILQKTEFKTIQREMRYDRLHEILQLLLQNALRRKMNEKNYRVKIIYHEQTLQYDTETD